MSKWFWEKINLFSGWITISILFVLIGFTSRIEIKDLDLWLHIATGRYIVQHGFIPSVDVLSCTIAGQPWINHEWLFQTIAHALYQWAGPEGIINLQSVIVLLTFALLFMMGYEKSREGVVSFFLLLVLMVFEIRFTHRPDLFSILFLTLFIYILSSKLHKFLSLWLLFIAQVLWTNTHGFFILGPAIVFLGFAAEWMKRHIKLPFEWDTIHRFDDGEYARIKQILLLVVLACFFNPYFVEGVLYPLKVLFSMGGESNIFFHHIKELERPIEWANIFDSQNYLSLKILILVSALSFLFNYRRIDVYILGLWLVFLWMALGAVRNVGFFSVIAYVAIIKNLNQMSWMPFVNLRFLGFKVQHGTAVLLHIILVVWMIQYMESLSLRGYFDFDNFKRKQEYAGGVSLRNFPYKAVDFLVQNNIQGNFFNDFNSGAYLLGRAHPHIKVFIDGRTEVYGSKFYLDYNAIARGDTKLFDRLADTYGLTGVFLNSVYKPFGQKILKHLYESSDWTLVYFDYDASIFLRNIPQNQLWIEKYKINLSSRPTEVMDLVKLGPRNVTPYRYVNRATVLFSFGLYDKAEGELKEALRITASDSDVYFLLGKIYLTNKDYEKAYENFRMSIVLSPQDLKAQYDFPQDLKVRYYLAYSLYQLNHFKEAERQCEKILRVRPNELYVWALVALIRIQENRYEEAIRIVKRLSSQSGVDTNKLAEVADSLSAHGQHKQAKELYAIISKINLDRMAY